MKIPYIIGIISGIVGIVATAISHNWTALIWAIAATGWATTALLKALESE